MADLTNSVGIRQRLEAEAPATVTMMVTMMASMMVTMICSGQKWWCSTKNRSRSDEKPVLF